MCVCWSESYFLITNFIKRFEWCSYIYFVIYMSDTVAVRIKSHWFLGGGLTWLIVDNPKVESDYHKFNTTLVHFPNSHHNIWMDDHVKCMFVIQDKRDGNLIQNNYNTHREHSEWVSVCVCVRVNEQTTLIYQKIG